MRWKSPTRTSGLQKALGWSRPKAQGPGLNSFVFACWKAGLVGPTARCPLLPWFLLRKLVGVSIPAETHRLKLVGGDWNHGIFMTSQILGMSSSQLTNSYFSEGYGSTTNQYGIFATCRTRCLEYPPFWISGPRVCGFFSTGCGLAAWSGTLIAMITVYYCARNTLGKALTHIHFIIINHNSQS